jgi:WD40 repeat protein
VSGGPPSWDDDSAPALSEDDEAPPAGADPRGFVQGPRYERRGLLGVGGMGKVYASKDQHLRREVALKEANSPELAARMAREARITAQLEHPGIVAVYDAGVTEDGRPWYTMRLIRGRTLHERLLQAEGLPRRLRLVGRFHAACQAVAYAHSMGLVHRDLKPANIMVGEFGETQVADWGLARPVPSREAEWSRIAGDLPPAGVAGTRRYMSPEQIQGAGPAETSDVWSLGVTLLELLSGERSQDRSIEELPEPVPAELAAIVAKCLRPDPAQRYPSAFELSEDLGRYLDGRRVEAHEYSPGELFVRLVRAWKAPLAVGGLALAVLTVVLVGAGQRMTEERATAEKNLAQALTQQALVALAADRIPEAEVLATHALALEESPAARGVLAGTSGPRPRLIERIALPEVCRNTGLLSPDGRHLACVGGGGVELWAVGGERVWRRDLPIDGNVEWAGDQLRLTTSDRMLVHLAMDGSESSMDMEEYAFTRLVSVGEQVIASSLHEARAFWPNLGEPFPVCLAYRGTVLGDGQRLILGCEDGWLRTYSGAGELLSEAPMGEDLGWSSTSVLSDGTVLIGGLFGEVMELDLVEGGYSKRLSGFDGSVLGLTEVPGSSYVLVRGERGGPRVWDRETNTWAGTLPSGAKLAHPGPVPGQAWLLGEALERWELPEHMHTQVTRTDAGIANIKVDPTGTRVAVTLGTGVVQLHDSQSGRVLQTWRWQDQVVKCVAFGPEGLMLAHGMEAAPAILRPDGQVQGQAGTLASYRRCGRFDDGQVWGMSWGPRTERIDLLVPEVVDLIESHTYFDGSSSPSGDLMAALSAEGRILIWGAGVERYAEHLDAVGVDVGDGGAPLVVIERDRLCVVGDRCVEVDARLIDVALSSQGLIAASTLSGEVLVYDGTTLELMAVLEGHSSRVASLEFSPDGSFLVTGGWDDSWRSWDLSRMSADPLDLLAEAEEAWQLSLEEALR